VNIEPIGGAVVEEDGLIDNVLEARLVLSKDLLIGNTQLSLILFSFLLLVSSRSNDDQMLQ